MATQQTHKLTMRPFIWSNDGPVLDYNAPAAAYFIDGMPNELIVQLINKSAHGREPLWKIRYVSTDSYIGEYKTEQEALLALERQLDENPLVAEDKLAMCKVEDCEEMVHSSAYVSSTTTYGIIMKCEGGHQFLYRSSDFHENQAWAKYQIVPFNHVTSHPSAAACCVREPHALGGVHIVKRLSWKKPRSFCVAHLLQFAKADRDLKHAWDEYLATSPRREQYLANSSL